MKLSFNRKRGGSVLITAFLTITILTLICATSLYITSQNQNSGAQTSSWQQALCGAEAGIDIGVRALNTATWTLSPAPSPATSTGQWFVATKPSNTPFPTTKPTPGSATAATGPPSAGSYNYYVFGSTNPTSPMVINMAGVSGSTNTPEGNPTISGWVTVDTANLTDISQGQWYRVRATGVAGTNGLFRASNNRLDNDLRHTIGLRFNRKTNEALNTAQATRTIEVVMKSQSGSLFPRAATLRSEITMSGGGVIDSYDSTNPFKSTNGAYDPTKRQTNGDIATLNSAGASDLKSTYVYGDLSYSGAPVKNTGNVQGNISTPFSTNIADNSNPTWSAGAYTSYSGGSPPFSTITTNATSGTKANPMLIKVNGDFTVPGGQSLNISGGNSAAVGNYVVIWVTGKLTTSGSGMINQTANANVTWVVDSDITVSGSSYNNMGGIAANLSIIGVGAHKATISGGGALVGTLNAPGYDVTISGSGSFNGSIIADTLNISGGASLHYDEQLNSGSGGPAGSFSFASWFEDNSDPIRKDVNGNTIIY